MARRPRPEPKETRIGALVAASAVVVVGLGGASLVRGDFRWILDPSMWWLLFVGLLFFILVYWQIRRYGE